MHSFISLNTYSFYKINISQINANYYLLYTPKPVNILWQEANYTKKNSQIQVPFLLDFLRYKFKKSILVKKMFHSFYFN